MDSCEWCGTDTPDCPAYILPSLNNMMVSLCNSCLPYCRQPEGNYELRLHTVEMVQQHIAEDIKRVIEDLNEGVVWDQYALQQEFNMYTVVKQHIDAMIASIKDIGVTSDPTIMALVPQGDDDGLQ